MAPAIKEMRRRCETSRRKPSFFFFFFFFLLHFIQSCFGTNPSPPTTSSVVSPASAPEDSKEETERIRKDPRYPGCSTSDIMITQVPTGPIHGILLTFSYMVEISNVSPTHLYISAIHLNCGWFTSAPLIINPKIFKRLGYNDCLVNNGQPLKKGRTLFFRYSNSFSYPLSVKSVKCS